MINREEAVKYFERHIDLYCVTGICREAEEMAIEALKQEPCEDVISRQMAIDAIEKYKIQLRHGASSADEAFNDGIETAISEIAHNVPSVVRENRTGHWIKQTLPVKPFGEDTVLCDKCAFMTDAENNYNYCPNCGCQMNGGEQDG